MKICRLAYDYIMLFYKIQMSFFSIFQICLLIANEIVQKIFSLQNQYKYTHICRDSMNENKNKCIYNVTQHIMSK